MQPAGPVQELRNLIGLHTTVAQVQKLKPCSCAAGQGPDQMKVFYHCYDEACPKHDQSAFCRVCADSGAHKCYPLREAGKALNYYEKRWAEIKEGSENLGKLFKSKVEWILPIVELIWTLRKDRGVADRDFLTKEVLEIPPFFEEVLKHWDDVERLKNDCELVALI